jgi:hypothetical protein
MIVIGVDVHKQSLTAVAVDEAGRALAEMTVAAAPSTRTLRLRFQQSRSEQKCLEIGLFRIVAHPPRLRFPSHCAESTTDE